MNVVFTLPTEWSRFAKKWLPLLSPAVQETLVELVEGFIASTSWWDAVMRRDRLAGRHQATLMRLGNSAAKGRNAGKGVQLDPVLLPIIQQLGTIFATKLSQRQSAEAIAALLDAIIPIEPPAIVKNNPYRRRHLERIREELRAKGH